MSLQTLTTPGHAQDAEGLLIPDLIEAIKLQKAQLDDYGQLDGTRQEQIKQLNETLQQCRDELSTTLVDSAKHESKMGVGAIIGYIVGVIGASVATTVALTSR